jgi:hypothetical protein
MRNIAKKSVAGYNNSRTLNNVVLTANSVKNGQKGAIANDISGEAQSVATSTF